MMEVMLDPKFVQLVHQIDPDSKLLRSWALTGGISAQVTALEVQAANGDTQKWVLRQHSARQIADNPQSAAHEFAIMGALQAAGVPVPAPIYLDESNSLFERPYLVMGYIEGETQFAPDDINHYIDQFTRQMVKIHAVDMVQQDLAFLPDQAVWYTHKLQNRPAVLDDSLQEGRIRDALEAVWPFPNMNAPALLHCDYWPGNILWQGDQLAAVIDFEDTAIGDPLNELANSRLEVLWAFGKEAMQAFTDLYQSLAPDLDYANLPYWDLFAVLRPASQLSNWAWDADDEHHMRDLHAWFVEDIFRRIG